MNEDNWISVKEATENQNTLKNLKRNRIRNLYHRNIRKSNSGRLLRIQIYME